MKSPAESYEPAADWASARWPVYSDADVHSLPVQMADTAVRIGPAPAPESYLNIPAIIKAAKQTGAQAVHPGFGFLAENAEFAPGLHRSGSYFCWTNSAAAIAAMGNKREAKNLVAAAGCAQ